MGIFSKDNKEIEVKKTDTKDQKKNDAKKAVNLESAKSIFIDKNIIRPWVSEKSNLMNEEGKYIFKVALKTSKNAVRDAIQSLYGINVTKVNILNIDGKPKRSKSGIVHRSKYKKAIVTLEKGQKIEALVL
ncbi:50S ribosomal protein L23 [bacterium]|nr:MAG: 50S ribosomal protein L23 [bacterium]